LAGLRRAVYDFRTLAKIGSINRKAMMWSITALVAVFLASEELAPVQLHAALKPYVEARTREFDTITDERKKRLDEIAEYVRRRLAAGQPARLTFICTHNSRRSHLAQIWAATAAAYYGAGGVETFSGGTEATAFNSRAVEALKRAGFDVSTVEAPSQRNPRYQVRFSGGAPPLECFSKVFAESPNPQTDFCAVMTCSQADAACPTVIGAAARFSLPYDDPKAFDGTPEESSRYDERCAQIGREMLYIFWNAAQ
jgi:arsenate reductase (thioredoxin)